MIGEGYAFFCWQRHIHPHQYYGGKCEGCWYDWYEGHR